MKILEPNKKVLTVHCSLSEPGDDPDRQRQGSLITCHEGLEDNPKASTRGDPMLHAPRPELLAPSAKVKVKVEVEMDVPMI